MRRRREEEGRREGGSEEGGRRYEESYFSEGFSLSQLTVQHLFSQLVMEKKRLQDKESEG